jgi:16S rRNA (cytosine967-C5)-methyltransferase
VRLECPAPWDSLLGQALGEHFAAEMAAAIATPPVDLRVNTLKATREVAIERLHWDKVEAKPMTTSPWGLRCAPETNVSATRAFRDGLVEFQDEASQLAALLCDARPGMQVMDFCSGTGGKTLALAAAMQNRGHIVACDISDVRLARAKIRMKRAGAENAERIKLPPTDTKDMKRLHGRFHRVLVDAPCSGTGSWRRNPDVRWSTHATNLAEPTALQASILARASHFVQPDGLLVYATCSLLPEENERQVETFLAANPGFQRVEARQHWASLTDTRWPCSGVDYLQLSPARNGTDGFFAAVLRKAAIRA